MEVLSETGLKVEYKKTRDLFRETGCDVDDDEKSVRIPEILVFWAAAQRKEIRENWMGEGLVRVSAGLENAEDLIGDLDQALRG